MWFYRLNERWQMNANVRQYEKCRIKEQNYQIKIKII